MERWLEVVGVSGSWTPCVSTKHLKMLQGERRKERGRRAGQMVDHVAGICTVSIYPNICAAANEKDPGCMQMS